MRAFREALSESRPKKYFEERARLVGQGSPQEDLKPDRYLHPAAVQFELVPRDRPHQGLHH